uniref:Uncharacterized protein n=1 Tax=Strigamia maritima TaxID=126957 RepID=T1JBC9_STRMM
MFVLRVLALACTAFAITQACELHEEMYKAGELFVVKFVVKHDKTIVVEEVLGCLRALMTGDVSKCNAQKFKLPQYPSCEKCVQHKNVKEKFAQYNVKAYTPMLENVLFSVGEDADEICEKLPVMAQQGLTVLESYMEGGEAAAAGVADKFCEKDKETCEQMKGLPDKIAAKFKFSFKDFIKQLKNTGKSKGVALGSSFSNGIKMAFGGDDFGEFVSKCTLELSEHL